jgi:hypothetical protein
MTDSFAGPKSESALRVMRAAPVIDQWPEHLFEFGRSAARRAAVQPLLELLDRRNRTGRLLLNWAPAPTRRTQARVNIQCSK